MKGSYRIRIQSKRVIYDFEIRRNITIITGDSAKGKTTLIDNINDYVNYGKDSGINLNCEKPCRVIAGANWESQLRDIKDSIVFIDEGNKFITSEDFAHAVKNSDNYYVIITREKLDNLPYSVNEIYGITSSGKYMNVKQVYNEMYPLYIEHTSKAMQNPTLVITEDEKSGYQFFEAVGKDKGFLCISANGKANIIKNIISRDNERILLVVDGAAFGPEMNAVAQIIKRFPNYALYAPESFEWLLLNSNIFKEKKLADILDNPSDYIESSQFFSWERYFTDLLERISKLYKGYEYNKEKINTGYLQENSRNKILNSIDKIDF